MNAARADAQADVLAEASADAQRAFGGIARLHGEQGLAVLRAGHVCVVGVGGVGSWAAEALVRSGVGRITLIDLDHVASSNLNRQIHALNSTLGAAKVSVMRERLCDIAPDCAVGAVEAFVDADNVEHLLPADAVLVDAIDAPRAKAAMIALCRARGQALVVCGAAGGRTDPLALAVDDLARVRGDALLAGVRARLRRDHRFPREPGRAFGVRAIHSREHPASSAPRGLGGAAPLACAGYGSVVTVTATMGMAAASEAIRLLLAQARRASSAPAAHRAGALPPAMPVLGA